jgi:hypothetical protein
MAGKSIGRQYWSKVAAIGCKGVAAFGRKGVLITALRVAMVGFAGSTASVQAAGSGVEYTLQTCISGFWHIRNYDISDPNHWVLLSDQPTEQPCYVQPVPIPGEASRGALGPEYPGFGLATRTGEDRPDEVRAVNQPAAAVSGPTTSGTAHLETGAGLAGTFTFTDPQPVVFNDGRTYDPNEFRAVNGRSGAGSDVNIGGNTSVGRGSAISRDWTPGGNNVVKGGCNGKTDVEVLIAMRGTGSVTGHATCSGGGQATCTVTDDGDKGDSCINHAAAQGGDLTCSVDNTLVPTRQFLITCTAS